MSVRRPRKVGSIVWAALGVAVGLTAAFFAGRSFVDAVPAALGRGQHGEFWADEAHCGKGCAWTGTFFSDDHSFSVSGVSYEDPGIDQVGDHVDAVVEHGVHSHRAYASHGSHMWVTFGGIALVCSLVGAGSAFALVESVRHPPLVD